VTRSLLTLLALLLAAPSWAGDGAKAVVWVPSHYSSGVVLETGDDWSHVGTAGHPYFSKEARERTVVVASTVDGVAGVGKVVFVDAKRDIALLRVNVRFPHVAPLAERANPGVLSCGYDSLRDGRGSDRQGPLVQAKVTPEEIEGTYDGHDADWLTRTRESVAVGRSGGPLLDAGGDTVGICHAIGWTPSGRSFGLHVSWACLKRSLERKGQP
jgi:hypothetical protein